jgi:hypothetical protein
MGPRAILGSEFKTFRYGSIILYKVLDKYKIMAKIKLIINPNINDIIISFIVVYM